MATLFARLTGEVDDASADPKEQRIPPLYFVSALRGVMDGVGTLQQLRNRFDLDDTGSDATQLTLLQDSFGRAVDKERWFATFYAAFVVEENLGSRALDAAAIQAWLATAESTWGS